MKGRISLGKWTGVFPLQEGGGKGSPCPKPSERGWKYPARAGLFTLDTVDRADSPKGSSSSEACTLTRES